MAGQNITAAQVYLLNHMNSVSNRVQLGTLIQNAENPGNQALASTKILVGDSGGTAQAVNLSGDATLSNTGVITIGAGATGLSKLASSVTAEATGTLTQTNILAMNGAAVSLIAGVTGVFLFIEFIELLHTYSTTVYAGGGVVSIQYTASTAITEFAKTVFTGASSAAYYQRPTLYDLDNSTGTGTGLTGITALGGLGVEITCASGAFTGGNVANIVKWRIRYKAITLLT